MTTANSVERRRKLLNLLVLVVPAQWCGLMTLYWMRFIPGLRPFAFHVPAPDAVLVLLGCAVSIVPFLLPKSYFTPLPFERRSFYRKLGLRWFRYLAPDGDMVNNALRRIDPSYRVIGSRADLRKHIDGTYANERAHLSLLIVGTLTSVHAFATEQHGWGWLLTVTNVVFNLYPVLHQRYKRARVAGRLMT